MTSKAARQLMRDGNDPLYSLAFPVRDVRNGRYLFVVFLVKDSLIRFSKKDGHKYASPLLEREIVENVATGVPYDGIQRVLFTPVRVDVHGNIIDTGFASIPFRWYFRRYIKDGLSGQGKDDYQNAIFEYVRASVREDFGHTIIGNYAFDDCYEGPDALGNQEYREHILLHSPLTRIGLYMVEHGFIDYPGLVSEPDDFDEPVYLERLLHEDYLERFKS